GNGSSRPLGSIVQVIKPTIPVYQLSSADAIWPTDSTGSFFKPKGYRINDKEEVTFLFEAYGASLEDGFSILQNGYGLKREIVFQNIPNELYFLIARGNDIKTIKKGLYLIEDKSFYIQLEENNSEKVILRNVHG